MRDKNFDSIKNFNVPENWVENALNIPQTEKKSPVTFIKFSRTLSAVASLVLVCALSVAVFFYTQKDDIVVPNKNVVESETVTQTTQSSTSDSSTQGSNNVEKPTDKTNIILPNGIIRPSVPVQIPTNNESGNQTKPIKPIKPDKPTQSPTYPNVEPSEIPTEDNTKPTQPLPTDPCPTTSILPTDDPPTVTPWLPTQPNTEPCTDKPTDKPNPSEPIASNECRVIISKKYIVKSGKMYCQVVSRADGSAVSPEKHLAVKVREYSDSTMFAFYPDDYNLIKKSGYYLCYFYNEDGTLVEIKEAYFYSN